MLRKSLAFLATITTIILAQAASNSISDVNNSFRIAFVLQNMHYRETSEKHGHEVTDDENSGTLPGMKLALYHEFGHIYTNINLQATNGNTPYKGTTVENNIPVNSDNNPSFMIDTNGVLGYRININRKIAVTPYAEVGYHTWERSSLPSLLRPNESTAGGQSDYSNNYYAGGLRLQIQPTNSLVFSLYGAAGRTFNAQVYNTKTKVSPDDPTHAGSTYGLQSRPWYNGGFDIDWAAAEHFHLFASLEYTYFKYGKSNVHNTTPNTQDGSDEPDSLTRYMTGYLGFGYDFGGDQGKTKDAAVHNSLGQFNNQAGFSLMALYGNYRLAPKAGSADDNIRTGTHSGVIPGGSLFFKHTFHHVLFKGYGEYAEGHVHYKSNDIANLNSTNLAKMNHYRGEFSLGYLIPSSTKNEIVPSVVLGFEHDNYVIKKTRYNFPESNVYYFAYTGLNLADDWQVSDRWIIAPNIEGGATFSNTIFAPLAQLQFHTASAPWYGAGVKVDYALSNNTNFISDLSFRQTEFKQSAFTTGVTSSLVATMPKARLNTAMLSFGLSFNT